jgi:hypothetical protein
VHLRNSPEFKKHKLVANGYKYTCPRNGPMIEYHVDAAHPLFQQRMNDDESTKFGGNLSVCNPNPDQPFIAFGQDECIFKQYLFTTKAWVATAGTKGLVPKDEILGVMILAFVADNSDLE